jgi:glycosyltransferase involved in cell wall biosynthesis
MSEALAKWLLDSVRNESMADLITLPREPKVTRRPAARRVRVMHLVLALNIGGLEKVVYDLTRMADREQFDVQVVCLGEVGALAGIFAEAGIPVRGLGVLGRGTLRAIRKVSSELHRERPDILHTHNPSPHLVGAVAARWAGVPIVIHTKHGRNYPGEFRKVWANRVATWFSDRVIAVSKNAADVARGVERVSAKKVEVVFNGIDLQKFCELSPSDRNVRRMIHVARLVDPPKDHATLLRAVQLIVKQVPDFQLEIVGDGPHRERIESLCNELDLGNHVTFHGFRHDVHELLRHCGLFILSTTTEGLSITLLEAMATGLPIVATRVGGNPEVVADGETGLLVPPESPCEMADAILKLICDPTRAAQMGAAGRARVEEYFDLRKVVTRYESLYRELLKSRRWQP